MGWLGGGGGAFFTIDELPPRAGGGMARDAKLAVLDVVVALGVRPIGALTPASARFV